MSVKRISANILSGITDNRLTKAETEKILSRKDEMTKAPESVGSFVSGREHKLVSELLDSVKKGEIQADAESLQMLEKFVAQGPDNRFKHIVQGGGLSTTAAKYGAMGPAITAGIGGASLGFLSGAFNVGIGFGLAYGAATGAVLSGAAALGGAAVGYLASAIYGAIDD